MIFSAVSLPALTAWEMRCYFSHAVFSVLCGQLDENEHLGLSELDALRSRLTQLHTTPYKNNGITERVSTLGGVAQKLWFKVPVRVSVFPPRVS
jgi:hypothetical protein